MKRAVVPSPQHRGYTLIELLVALLIVGILVAVAYPAYLRNVIRGNRADAQSQLIQAGQYLERYYSTHDTYTSSLPTALSGSPANGTQIYTIAVALSANSQSWTLTATPVPTGPNRKDGYIQLDSQRNRYWDANNNGTIESTENTWTQ